MRLAALLELAAAPMVIAIEESSLSSALRPQQPVLLGERPCRFQTSQTHARRSVMSITLELLSCTSGTTARAANSSNPDTIHFE